MADLECSSLSKRSRRGRIGESRRSSACCPSMSSTRCLSMSCRSPPRHSSLQAQREQQATLAKTNATLHTHGMSETADAGGRLRQHPVPSRVPSDTHRKNAAHKNLQHILVATSFSLTRGDWRDFVEEAERKRTGVQPDNQTILERTDDVVRVARQVPEKYRRILRKPYRIRPKEGDRVYMIRGGIEIPGIGRSDGTIAEVWIDGVGEHHPTGAVRQVRRNPVIRACMWRHIKEWQREWGLSTGRRHRSEVDRTGNRSLPGEPKMDGR